MSRADELADTLEVQARTMRLAGQDDAVTEAHDRAAAMLRSQHSRIQNLEEGLSKACTRIAEQGMEIDRLVRENERLSAVNAELLADATRYRWLRKNNGNWRVQVAITRKEGDVYNWVHAMEGLDAVIDAAIQKAEEA